MRKEQWGTFWVYIGHQSCSRHTTIDVFTLELSDTVSQLPPVKENFPDPIRRRISSGVSFGPLANGVYLTGKRQRLGKRIITLPIAVIFSYSTFVTLTKWMTPHTSNSNVPSSINSKPDASHKNTIVLVSLPLFCAPSLQGIRLV